MSAASGSGLDGVTYDLVKTNCSGVAADSLLGRYGSMIVVAVGEATCESAGGPALSMALPGFASSTTEGMAPLSTGCALSDAGFHEVTT